MAKYKNREVRILREIPHAEGDQVAIEHLELPGQSEIVPRGQVIVTKDELKALQKTREDLKKQGNREALNDYRVENENEVQLPTLPTYKDVQIQRAAEDNLGRAEKQAKDNEEWAKKHPKLPATAKTQLDAIKVVPYRDEPKK